MLTVLGVDSALCFGDSVVIPTIVSGGSGNYLYSWSPSNFLSDPTIQNPTFYADEAKYLMRQKQYSEALKILDLAKDREIQDDFTLSIRATIFEDMGQHCPDQLERT